ncbi:hypothetical protein SESBI_01729 [Sesbania bispinosa]|nr:hypothetical protein SESBI_01729 [Sesbania bispinosa]
MLLIRIVFPVDGWDPFFWRSNGGGLCRKGTRIVFVWNGADGFSGKRGESNGCEWSKNCLADRAESGPLELSFVAGAGQLSSSCGSNGPLNDRCRSNDEEGLRVPCASDAFPGCSNVDATHVPDALRGWTRTNAFSGCVQQGDATRPWCTAWLNGLLRLNERTRLCNELIFSCKLIQRWRKIITRRKRVFLIIHNTYFSFICLRERN